MLLADDAELGRPHRLGVLLERRQQLRDVVGVGLVESEEVMQRDVRGAGLGQNSFLLRGPRHAAELADEFADRDVSAIGDVRRHVAAKAALVVPVRRRRPRRQPLLPCRVRRLDVDLHLAIPGHAKAQMRIEPRVGLGELAETSSLDPR